MASPAKKQKTGKPRCAVVTTTIYVRATPAIRCTRSPARRIVRGRREEPRREGRALDPHPLAWQVPKAIHAYMKNAKEHGHEDTLFVVCSTPRPPPSSCWSPACTRPPLCPACLAVPRARR